MSVVETTQARNPEQVYLSEKLAVIANAFLQNIGLEKLPFVETFSTVTAKLNGIRGTIRSLDFDIRVIIPTRNSAWSQIRIDNVPPEKLEAVMKELRSVKIAVQEIIQSHYLASEELYYTIVVYKGK